MTSHHPARPPDVRRLLDLLESHGVRYVIAGSFAAALHGVDVQPGDLDIVPALDPANLERLATVLRELEAIPVAPGKWETTSSGERRWVASEKPSDPTAAWVADPTQPATMDHLFATRLGNFDVVPALAGSYEQLEPRATLRPAFEHLCWTAPIECLLERLTVPRRPKDTPRVHALRQLQSLQARRERETLAAAERALERAWKSPVRLRPDNPIRAWGRHTLLSCVVKQGPDAAPATVVIKEANTKNGAICAEWAGLELLGDLPGTRTIVPVLYGGDVERELIVLEDLGAGPTLHHILQSKRAWAVEALVDDMAALARVHGHTRGHGAKYAAARSRLTSLPDVPTELDETLAALPASFGTIGDALGLDVSAPAAELQQVAQRMRIDAGLSCFTFDDQCPPNRILTHGRLRFVNLEMGRFRHPFVDGAYPLIGHLRCMDGLRLPPAVQRDMLDAYRGALAPYYPELIDDARFELELSSACALWLVRLLRPLPRALGRDRTVGFFQIRSRQRILASLDAFVAVESAARHLPALTAACDRIARALRQAWPESAPGACQRF